MKQYTIGILFRDSFQEVLLIKKTKPEWQKDKLNFPGGHVEQGETFAECVAREFKEETNLGIPASDWINIGRINNELNYFVDVFTAVLNPDTHGEIKAMTEEIPLWVDANKLPHMVISNLKWLVPFAINIHKQGNADNLIHGTFEYRYL